MEPVKLPHTPDALLLGMARQQSPEMQKLSMFYQAAVLHLMVSADELLMALHVLSAGQAD